ncbi:MAG TPA: serine/threonine-protein kinase [Fimbriiglobus sp.]|jgi:serine/threonine protein kinase
MAENETSQEFGKKSPSLSGSGSGPSGSGSVASEISTGTVVATAEVEALSASAPPIPSASSAKNIPPELAQSTQYADVRELGRGGMGVVYLARNVMMNRLEVLKIVNKALLEWPGASDRFIREIRSAAKLRHPNVVGAFSAQQIGDLLVFAMEYVEGVDLSKLLKSRGPLPIPNACYYVYQAALGLQHAHEKQMVHRDIKPSNLILTREGKKQVVKILDFGLAKGTGEQGIEESLSGAGKMVLCTPDYVAPEQIKDNSQTDIRSDIYSLGCTLYYLISGQLPFAGKDIYEVLAAHRSSKAIPLTERRPEVPDGLSSLVAKMMAKNPAHRFQTPAEVAVALKAFFRPALDVEVVQSGIVLTPVDRVPAAAPPPKPNPLKTSTKIVRAILDEAPVQGKKRSRPVVRETKKPLSLTRLIVTAIGSCLILALFIAWSAGAFKGGSSDKSSNAPASPNGR